MNSDQPLPRPQHVVLQSLASYFKIPYKKLRESVNRGSSEASILASHYLIESELNFSERFFCSEGAFKLASLWEPNKFKKTKFYLDYLDYLQHRGIPEVKWAYCIGGSNALVITSYEDTPPTIKTGTSLIHVGHANKGGGISIVPLKTYLKDNYPSPPCE